MARISIQQYQSMGSLPQNRCCGECYVGEGENADVTGDTDYRDSFPISKPEKDIDSDDYSDAEFSDGEPEGRDALCQRKLCERKRSCILPTRLHQMMSTLLKTL